MPPKNRSRNFRFGSVGGNSVSGRAADTLLCLGLARSGMGLGSSGVDDADRERLLPSMIWLFFFLIVFIIREIGACFVGSVSERGSGGSSLLSSSREYRAGLVTSVEREYTSEWHGAS